MRCLRKHFVLNGDEAEGDEVQNFITRLGPGRLITVTFTWNGHNYLFDVLYWSEEPRTGSDELQSLRKIRNCLESLVRNSGPTVDKETLRGLLK